MKLPIAVTAFALVSGFAYAEPPPPPITADAAAHPVFEPVGPKSHSAAVLRVQVLLDHARFSPGEIDGSYGNTLRVAIRGYQKKAGLPQTGTVDQATWDALAKDAQPTLAKYRVSAADVAGPFAAVPKDMMEQAKLPALGYGSPAEALGEKFHASPALLQELNPGKDLAKEGEKILVPNVIPHAGPLAGVDRIVVDRSDSTVSMVAEDGTVLAQYPASTGSEHDPLPIGSWKILGVDRDPSFHYNPKLFWDAKDKKGQSKATIKPGPNNPVGIVWVDLSKNHYGIHGTPEPSHISKTESHGCIRLTNWDAWTLSYSVRPGMPAVLQE